MKTLPIGCTARYEEIKRRSDELLTTFINGNRKDALAELEDMEQRAALAVLARMVAYAPSQERVHLVRFFTEMA